MAKRLVKGKDFHGWAWKHTGNDKLRGLFFYAEPFRPNRSWPDYIDGMPSEEGKWVRVKFVEVK